MEITDEVRRYWNADAATYDLAPEHGATTPALRAAWRAVLAEVLPEPPARVLDVGAGTGFLALNVARLGYATTACDLSSGMLSKLKDSALRADLDVAITESSAEEPPAGPFDAVVARHLLWTLPDPAAALRAWRERTVPGGTLAVFESVWGAGDPAERRRGQLREAARRVRRQPTHHHAELDPRVRAEMPYGSGITPDDVCELVEQTGWEASTIARLRDVEWARLLEMDAADRALGTHPRYVVTAHSGAASGTP